MPDMLPRVFLSHALPGVVLALTFRLLPFAVAGAASRRVGAVARLAIVLMYGALPASLVLHDAEALAALAWLVPAWAYLLASAWATFALSGSPWMPGLSRPAVFVCTAFLFVVAPGVMLGGLPSTLLLATGFELMFSAFSYCVEPSARQHPRRLSDCLRFLLLNPTLVYVASGIEIGPPALRRGFLWRVLQGLALLLAQALSAVTLAQRGYGYGAGWGWDGTLSAYPAFAITLFASLIVQYLGHAGLASVQIGLMGCLGRHLPERYHYPFLARDPLDLWRRWNTYLGLWLQRYVFFPLALHWQQRWKRGPRDAGKAVAVIVTFAVGGLAHELAGYSRSFVLPVGAFLGFMLCGAAIVVWLGLRRLALVRLLAHRVPALRLLFTVASGALTSTLLLVFGWVALPALAGLGLPLALQRWLGL